MKLNLITLALAVIAATVLLMRASHLPWTPVRIIGTAIAVPAFLLLALARMQLGSAFSVSAKATTLVTAGLYSRIRNPIYVFGALTIAGVIIWTGKFLLLLWLLVVVPLQFFRSRKEEQVLTEKFGEAYLKYKQKTWF